MAIAQGEKLADRLIGRITEDHLEVVFTTLRPTKAASTRNHHLQTINARKGYLLKPWLGEFTSLKRQKHARRDRRIIADELGKDGKAKVAGEERRLLAAATQWLRRLIIAAVETGCRHGESLQGSNVSLQSNTLTIRLRRPRTAIAASSRFPSGSRECWSWSATTRTATACGTRPGSRFLEVGWPLHHVQEMPGHADKEQTSTYLNVTQGGLPTVN